MQQPTQNKVSYSLQSKEIQDLISRVEKTKVPPFDAFIGYKIRARRKALKYSQPQLAYLLDLTFQQVQKYEKGINRITAERLWELTHIFQVDFSYFFEGLMPFLSNFKNPNQLPSCYEIAKNHINLNQDSIFTVIEKLDAFMEKRPYDANKPLSEIVKDLHIKINNPNIYEELKNLSAKEASKKYASIVNALPKEEQKRFRNASLYFKDTPQEELFFTKDKQD